MTKRIKVADLPDFDAAPYLDNEEAVAAYLTDILEANDPCPRHERDCQGVRINARSALQGAAG
jgi:DNA-binding phage protein